MRNYIKAELYRSFNRLYFWNFTFIISILALSYSVILKITSVFPNMGLSELFITGTQLFNMPVFLVIMIIDMITSEELKNQTLKNVVSSGIPRNKLVLSKIIVTVILSFISATIILTAFFGTGAMLFGVGTAFASGIAKDFVFRLLAALPLWIGTISVGTLLSFIYINNTTFAFVYAGIFAIAANVVRLLSILVSDKFGYIYNNLITVNLKNLATSTNLLLPAAIGFMYTMVFTILSILYFEKMEVK